MPIQSAALKAAIALIPKDDSSLGPFWQDAIATLLEHVADALGPEATTETILAHASLPKREFEAWAEALPAGTPAKEWFLTGMGTDQADDIQPRLAVLAEMAKQLSTSNKPYGSVSGNPSVDYVKLHMKDHPSLFRSLRLLRAFGSPLLLVGGTWLLLKSHYWAGGGCLAGGLALFILIDLAVLFVAVKDKKML